MPKLLPKEIKTHFPCLLREENGQLLQEMRLMLHCKRCTFGQPDLVTHALQLVSNTLQDTLWSTWIQLPLRRGKA